MEKRLEKRLSLVYSKMKKEREANTVSNDIKNMLDEFRKVSKEDLTSRQLNASEIEKQKVTLSLNIQNQLFRFLHIFCPIARL